MSLEFKIGTPQLDKQLDDNLKAIDARKKAFLDAKRQKLSDQTGDDQSPAKIVSPRMSVNAGNRPLNVYRPGYTKQASMEAVNLMTGAEMKTNVRRGMSDVMKKNMRGEPAYNQSQWQEAAETLAEQSGSEYRMQQERDALLHAKVDNWMTGGKTIENKEDNKTEELNEEGERMQTFINGYTEQAPRKTVDGAVSKKTFTTEDSNEAWKHYIDQTDDSKKDDFVDNNAEFVSGGMQIDEDQWNQREAEMTASAKKGAEEEVWHNRSGAEEVTAEDWNQREAATLDDAKKGAEEEAWHNRSGAEDVTAEEWNQRETEMLDDAKKGAEEEAWHNRSGAVNYEIDPNDPEGKSPEWKRDEKKNMAERAAMFGVEKPLTPEQRDEMLNQLIAQMQQDHEAMFQSKESMLRAKNDVGKASKLFDRLFRKGKKEGAAWEDYNQRKAQFEESRQRFTKSFGKYGQFLLDEKRTELRAGGMDENAPEFRTAILAHMHNLRMFNSGEVDKEGNPVIKTLAEGYHDIMNDLNNLQVEGLSDQDKSIFRKISERYNALPKWKKVMFGAAMGAGIGVAGGLTAGMGMAALGYGAWRGAKSVLRSTAGAALSGFAQKVVENKQTKKNIEKEMTEEDFLASGQEKLVDKIDQKINEEGYDKIVEKGLLRGVEKQMAELEKYNAHAAKQMRNRLIAAGLVGGASSFMIGGLLNDSVFTGKPKLTPWHDLESKGTKGAGSFNPSAEGKFPEKNFAPEPGGAASEALKNKPEDLFSDSLKKGDNVWNKLEKYHQGNQVATANQLKDFKNGMTQQLMEQQGMSKGDAQKFIEWKFRHLRPGTQISVDSKGALHIDGFADNDQAGRFNKPNVTGGAAAAEQQHTSARPKVENGNHHRPAGHKLKVDYSDDYENAKRDFARMHAEEDRLQEAVDMHKGEAAEAQFRGKIIDANNFFRAYDQINFQGNEFARIQNVRVGELIERTMAGQKSGDHYNILKDALADAKWRSGTGIGLPHDGGYGYNEFKRQRNFAKIVVDYLNHHPQEQAAIERGTVQQFMNRLNLQEAA
jgi:hypothetical protein